MNQYLWHPFVTYRTIIGNPEMITNELGLYALAPAYTRFLDPRFHRIGSAYKGRDGLRGRIAVAKRLRVFETLIPDLFLDRIFVTWIPLPHLSGGAAGQIVEAEKFLIWWFDCDRNIDKPEIQVPAKGSPEYETWCAASQWKIDLALSLEEHNDKFPALECGLAEQIRRREAWLTGAAASLDRPYPF